MKTKQNTMKITILTSIIFCLMILVSASVLAAPTITSVSPANNAINISVSPIPTISAVFNETMNSTTLYSIGSVLMQDQNGVSSSPSLSYNAATKNLSINPMLASLNYNSNYTITITTKVKNLFGVSLTQNYTWSFRTPVLVTTITPVVSSVNPADGSNNINAYVPNIWAKFNSSIMDSATMNSATILLKDQANNPVSLFVGSYDSALKKISINPWNTLNNNTQYTATITTGVKDLAGTSLAQNYSWTFTTAISSTPPQPPNTFVFNVTANPGGTISPSGTLYYTYLSFHSFTITPNPGYHITNVYLDGQNLGPRTALNSLISSHNTTIIANFAADTPTSDITATAGLNGAITPSGINTIVFAGNQTFSWTADSGFVVNNVVVDGVVVYPAQQSYTFTNVMDPHSIIVDFIPNTLYISASVGTGGTISSSGVSNVTAFASKQYLISPNADYFLDYVIIDGVPTTTVPMLYWSPYIYNFVNVNANHTISAIFSQRIFNITSIAGVNGNIAPLGTIGVNRLSNKAYTITPNTNYHVANVLVDGVSVGPVTSYTFISVNATHTINASFALNTVAIISSAGLDGIITPNGTTQVTYNGNQAYTITPNAGFHILDVQIDGFSIGPIPAYMFTFVTIPHTINAVFIANSFNITSSASANGAITPSGITTVITGNSQTYNLTPNAGYSITDVLVDGASVGPITNYTFANVNATHTITATFADTIPPVITLTGTSPVNVAFGSTYFDAGATATDNVDFVVAVNSISTVDTGVIGTYSVTYGAMDAAGNNATPVVRTINVVDLTAPIITLLGNTTETVVQNAVYTDSGATALDDIDGVVVVITTGVVDTAVVGVYTITYTATDAALNTAVAIRIVNVVDTTAPVITLLGVTPLNVTQGAVYSDAGATATDNIDGNITANIVVVNSVNTAVLGAYTVTYNIIDAALNPATQVVRTINVIAVTPVCQTTADTNGNGVISITEVAAHINAWKQGQVSITQVATAINLWKAGAGC